MFSKTQIEKLFTPICINIMGVIFGLISLIIGYLCSIVEVFIVPSFIRDVFYAVGGSFVAGAILNIISEYKIGNLLVQTVLNAVYGTAASARRIRYKQSIKFIIKNIFKSTTGEPYFKLDCEHTYTIYRETPLKRKTNIDIFNGLNISTESNDSLFDEDKTRFEEVKITHSSTSDVQRFSFSNPEHKKINFKFDEYGQPRFLAEDIKIGDKIRGYRDWIQVSYIISNAHYLKSQHPWYFQELSDGLELTIENKTKYPNSCFSLIINHPNREEIELGNKKYINDNGRLKDGNPSFQIKTDLIFLPYQGFTLKWDLTEYAKQQKETACGK